MAETKTLIEWYKSAHDQDSDNDGIPKDSTNRSGQRVTKDTVLRVK